MTGENLPPNPLIERIEELIEGGDSPQLDLGDEDSGRRDVQPPGTTAEFYAAYPKHKARPKALKAYQAVLKKEDITPAVLLASAHRAASAYQQDVARRGKEIATQYFRQPSSWLDDEGWADEPAQPAGNGQVAQHSAPSAATTILRLPKRWHGKLKPGGWQMGEIIQHPGASNGAVATGCLDDRFALVLKPAQPVLKAMTQLRKVRTFMAERDRWDPNRNSTFGYLMEQIALIPDAATLRQAKHLFHEAEHVPAPEEWLYLAIGVLLAAAPNSGKGPVDYTLGLVDSIIYDEELHRGYDELGFSFAVAGRSRQHALREHPHPARRGHRLRH